MLDNMALSDKIEVARQWIAQSLAGTLPPLATTAGKLDELLAACRQDAQKLEQGGPGGPPWPTPADLSGEPVYVGVDTGTGQPAPEVYLPEEFRTEGFLEDMARPTAEIVPFARRRLGGAS